MIPSPLYQEIVEEAKREGATETTRRHILKTLKNRFGDEAEDLRIELDAVEYDRLEDLFDQATNCPSLAGFRERILFMKGADHDRIAALPGDRPGGHA